ncbi:uncharacterized protein [Coffea arabica]|uniref:Uncharacterized protein isoform X1 n=1 Tax=Coffea arabica TaxID=13443 RepID=A0A6P6UKV9_COFAR|nr:uncharacterized protein LOC113712038 isoform X1 [Coffea arabica]
MEGNWEVACSEFRSNQNAKTAKISNLGMTALHVAASCGQSEFVQKLVEKLAKKHLAKLQLEARDQLGRTALHHVALAADVDAAKAMVNENPILPYFGDVNKHTPLFYAAKWRKPSESKRMVEYLYRVSRDEDLLRDHVRSDLCNAFTDASAPDLIVAITASGSYDAALRILERYPELALKKNDKGTSILHVLAMKPKAFRRGNELSPLRSWIYDLVPVDDEETEHEDSTSDVANSKNRCSAASFFKYLGKFIKGIRQMSEMKQSHLRAVRLVKFVCDELQKKEREEEMDSAQDFFIPENSTAILHLAVEHGVFELVEQCLKVFPDLIWYADKPRKSVPWRHAHYTSTVKGSLVWNDATQHADTATASSNPPGTKYTDATSGQWHEGQYADIATRTGRLLLHVAIEHRRVQIFNYMITYIGKNTKAYADLKLEGNNNSLHLAAKLAPTPQLQAVPGPAFQMQREFQWFRAVEELVYDELKTEKNLDDKTPQELFFDAHQELLKNAKEWMKDTSNSCTVVGALVATVSFAAVITVPGGNDNATGIAVLARNKLFMVFLVSNSISLANSAASLLMFLSVQTSRYSEEDFLESLPQTFVRGLFILFIAIVTMMISFGTAIGLSLQSSFKWAHIATFIVACFPAIILGMSHLPLLLQPAAGRAIFRGQRDREPWCIKKIGCSLLAYDRV